MYLPQQQDCKKCFRFSFIWDSSRILWCYPGEVHWRDHAGGGQWGVWSGFRYAVSDKQTDRQITKELVPLLVPFYTHANMFNCAANVLAMLRTKQCVVPCLFLDHYNRTPCFHCSHRENPALQDMKLKFLLVFGVNFLLPGSETGTRTHKFGARPFLTFPITALGAFCSPCSYHHSCRPI